MKEAIAEPKAAKMTAAAPEVATVVNKVSRPTQVQNADGTITYKCQFCGKKITAEDAIEAEAGSYCHHLREQGLDDAALADIRSGKTVAEVPEGWVKIAAVHHLCDARGIPISALVRCFGGDRGLDPVLEPRFAFVYCGKARWVDGWVATSEGLAFIAKEARKAKIEKSEAASNKAGKTVKPRKSVVPDATEEALLEEVEDTIAFH